MDTDERLNAIIISNSDQLNHCSNCLLCLNKQFNPFCVEWNKSVELNNQSCNEYERN